MLLNFAVASVQAKTLLTDFTNQSQSDAMRIKVSDGQAGIIIKGGKKTLHPH